MRTPTIVRWSLWSVGKVFSYALPADPTYVFERVVSGVREEKHLKNLKEEKTMRRVDMRLTVAHLSEAKGMLLSSLLVTLIICLAIVIAGCFLVYLGATGHTELEIFDTKVDTTSVGVVGIVCGTLIAILNTRRLLHSIEKLAALPPDEPVQRKKA